MLAFTFSSLIASNHLSWAILVKRVNGCLPFFISPWYIPHKAAASV